MLCTILGFGGVGAVLTVALCCNSDHSDDQPSQNKKEEEEEQEEVDPRAKREAELYYAEKPQLKDEAGDNQDAVAAALTGTYQPQPGYDPLEVDRLTSSVAPGMK